MRPRLLALVAAGLLVACGEEPWGFSPGISGSITHGDGPSPIRPSELTGGTMLVTAGGRLALVSDPDRELVWVVDLDLRRIRSRIGFPAGSGPSRLVEDGRGQVHVSLRRSGQLATLSPTTGAVLATQTVCPEPRGVTFDEASASVVVACASGELVTVGSQGVVVRQTGLELRDAWATPQGFRALTFRSATVVDLDPEGATTRTTTLPEVALPDGAGQPASFAPRVAWRGVRLANGSLVVVHQRHVEGDISAIQVPTAPPAPAYYGNTCSSAVVRSAVSVIDAEGRVTGSRELGGVLPVDLALSKDGTRLAVASAASHGFEVLPVSHVAGAGVSGGTCGTTPRAPAFADDRGLDAVGFTPKGDLVVHATEPNRIELIPLGDEAPARILLSAAPIATPGSTLFHDATASPGTTTVPIACASCHPEGREDGHVWTFFQKKVRTQTTAGGIGGTAPFHWSGTLRTTTELLDDTFVTRMGHAKPSLETVRSLDGWVAGIAAPKRSSRATAEQLAHGEALFNDPTVGCATCHSGVALTNNATVDVGTGGKFQVPSLRGVASRGPWMHDGCATSLRARFEPGSCGGTAHGQLGRLTSADLDDLTAWLETL